MSGITATDVEAADRFPFRARVVLVVLVTIELLGALLVAVAPAPADVQLTLLVLLGLNLAFTVWLWNGLGDGTVWARPVVILTLWLMALTGIVDTIVAFAEGRINIPIGTLLALWALAAPAGPFRIPEIGADRTRAIAGCLAALALFLVPPVLGSLMFRS